MKGSIRLLESLLGKPQSARYHYVRNSERYRDPRLCRALLDRSRQLRFSDPVQMLELAELAVEVSLRCRLSVSSSADLATEAWLGVGNALMVSGDLRGADAAFETAIGFEKLGSGSYEIRCKRCEWLASLRTRQGRLREAGLLLADAFRCRPASEPHPRASILIQAGIIAIEAGQPFDGLVLTTEAMDLIDLRKDPKLGLIARHHGARCLYALGRIEDALQTIDYLAPLYRSAGDPIIQVRQLWLRAEILASFGSEKRDREAEAAYQAAVTEASKLRLPYETACLLLQFGEWYSQRGRHGLLEGLIDDLLPVLENLGMNSEALAARLLRGAIDQRNVFSEVRQLLEQQRERAS
jgi:tetratricopeptide (TPR) repeat protein